MTLFVLALAILATAVGLWGLGDYIGFRRGWHAGRAALIKQQQTERVQAEAMRWYAVNGPVLAYPNEGHDLGHHVPWPSPTMTTLPQRAVYDQCEGEGL